MSARKCFNVDGGCFGIRKGQELSASHAFFEGDIEILLSCLAIDYCSPVSPARVWRLDLSRFMGSGEGSGTTRCCTPLYKGARLTGDARTLRANALALYDSCAGLKRIRGAHDLKQMISRPPRLWEKPRAIRVLVLVALGRRVPAPARWHRTWAEGAREERTRTRTGRTRIRRMEPRDAYGIAGKAPERQRTVPRLDGTVAGLGNVSRSRTLWSQWLDQRGCAVTGEVVVTTLDAQLARDTREWMCGGRALEVVECFGARHIWGRVSGGGETDTRRELTTRWHKPAWWEMGCQMNAYYTVANRNGCKDTRATERYHTLIILMSFVSHDDLNNDESKWGGREEMKCVATHWPRMHMQFEVKRKQYTPPFSVLLRVIGVDEWQTLRWGVRWRRRSCSSPGAASEARLPLARCPEFGVAGSRGARLAHCGGGDAHIESINNPKGKRQTIMTHLGSNPLHVPPRRLCVSKPQRVGGIARGGGGKRCGGESKRGEATSERK
ncbi:hypothetical protein C8J57DRAFT_1478753 [Mycena rebaudengoi]|nr:hypothetical protein C8J57DRAFT_1478753 [Mycena rebaudengoi]